MPYDSIVLGLADYQIKHVERCGGEVAVWVRYTGPTRCPHCEGTELRKKARYERHLRHETWGLRRCRLYLEGRKFHCQGCGRYFNQRFPGILPRRRSTEPFRRQIFWRHFDGISRKRLAQREGIGSATVERWFQDYLKLQAAKLSGEPCPQELGLDEHFFTRRRGFATTLCDLKNHKVYDVVLGRSAASLDSYFRRLRGKEQVRLVCMDLASNYRALVRRHFPNARIIADRFHVVRLVNQQFLSTWRELDPQGSKHRGLLSLMRRHQHRLSQEQQQRLQSYFQAHPHIHSIYAFKQRLCALLTKKTHTPDTCARRLIPELLQAIHELKGCGLPALEQLGRTLGAWAEEIAALWRFTKSNGITEGFHNKMEMLSRQAFGFRSFENYRLRVRVMCA
jgi:transposase